MNNFALLVCFNILSSVSSPSTITLTTISGTAEGIAVMTIIQLFIVSKTVGGEDYVEFTSDISLDVGQNRMCTTAIILNDNRPEIDETFLISHVGTNVATQVIILNDDGNE